jgi:16S rRNA (cytosine1402-N4)-methyltransferase
MDTQYHVPVLQDEALGFLISDTRKTYVDATVGGGGHAERICELLQGQGSLICFDADTDAIAFARERLGKFRDRVTFVHSNFRNLRAELQALQVVEISGLLLDLGVSSFQLDEATKGFSYRSDAPIDMRMDRRQNLTGWDVVNTYSEQTLADVLYRFGEERQSRRIARVIVGSRTIQTTRELSVAIESAVGKRHLPETLSRVFQAVRIEVNGELKNLEAVLEDSLDVLSPGGRVVVISYHSLEDRIVKDFFRRESRGTIPSGSKYLPDRVAVPKMKILTKKPVRAKADEIERNPRARSAKMRVAERL